MANRDDIRGEGGQGRWRNQDWSRDDGRRDGGERRSFDDDRRRMASGPRGGRGEGEDQAWNRDRYGSRYDQDRVNYGSGYDRDRGEYGRGVREDTSRYGQGRSYEGPAGGQSGGYRGQEYGMESRGGERGQGYRSEPWERGRGWDQPREQWRREGDAPYGDLELNARNRGVQDYGAPHDYAYHPEAGHEFEPDYVAWRDEQMRGHDRDYQEWRAEQHRQYDEDYRKFRQEKRHHFGRTFADWRSQRSAVGGVPDLTVGPGVSGYGDKTANSAYTKPSSSYPSGRLEPMEKMENDPALRQTGGGDTGQAAGGGDGSPEFGKEPPQVKAAADGGDATRVDKGESDKTRTDKGEDKRH